MLTLHQSATALHIDADEILQWHRLGRCIGVFTAEGDLRLPKWQVEPEIWFQVEPICECLGTADGWEILSFLESPADGLGGLTPRTALERRVPAEWP